MSKDKDLIEATGKIIEVLPNQMFKVILDDFDNANILAYTGGKMRKNRIRIVEQDRVKVEISPYDFTKGRITFRI
jgi:translation initiation factor IF-1|tara:strand:- start:118 stop:342 length:225 start_codon:yes stop_codon:yes gene_type:complete